MTTILVGVDDSERSEDAVAFADFMARASGAHVTVASVFPYDDAPSRAANLEYRQAIESLARRTARRMAEPLSSRPDAVSLTTVARTSAPRGLHDLAEELEASLLVVGSSHVGAAGRVLPGSTAERLLDGAPCAVAVVARGYRDRRHGIRAIGVAYDGSPEADTAGLI